MCITLCTTLKMQKYPKLLRINRIKSFAKVNHGRILKVGMVRTIRTCNEYGQGYGRIGWSVRINLAHLINMVKVLFLKSQIFWILTYPISGFRISKCAQIEQAKIENLNRNTGLGSRFWRTVTVVDRLWASMGNFEANIHVIKPQSSFRRKLPFMIFMNFHEQSPFHDQKLKKISRYKIETWSYL